MWHNCTFWSLTPPTRADQFLIESPHHPHVWSMTTSPGSGTLLICATIESENWDMSHAESINESLEYWRVQLFLLVPTYMEISFSVRREEGDTALCGHGLSECIGTYTIELVLRVVRLSHMVWIRTYISNKERKVIVGYSVVCYLHRPRHQPHSFGNSAME